MNPLKISYLFFILVAVSCQKSKPSYQSKPDAVRDLLVDRISWKPQPAGNRTGIQRNEHTFSITNTSREHGYRQIQVRFDYYDAHYHRIGTEHVTLPQSLEARSMVAILPIQVGTANPLTTSATVRIERAVSE
ncbi:hypothetical protein [Spirosoma sp. KUDC1026]|uniref:hypothetical protein n=1 Tax=Spirosoma sp. KUDC1026 TaxID=2745947 RepID=UPI00159BD941|nr:hypothetical protein [Spirosoma sp. KUDC1026]QKZ14327.1 hypothetical protein HU175_17510 [Spirosoma sp. KUDC1026]